MSRTLAILLVLTALGAGPSPAADTMYSYVKEDGSVVFTNTPSRRDVKPAFRMDRQGVRYSGATLPKTKYDAYIDKVARENGLDPTLIKAVALVESGFNPKAVSNKGAKGIMQFMPSTAKRYGVTDLHDPYQSLKAGAEHLADLLEEFDGNLAHALAAYNAGAGAVRRAGGVPDYKETQDYVKKIQTKLGKGTRRSGPGVTSASAGKVILKQNRDGSIVLYN